MWQETNAKQPNDGTNESSTHHLSIRKLISGGWKRPRGLPSSNRLKSFEPFPGVFGTVQQGWYDEYWFGTALIRGRAEKS
jgi:hypothetical protein